MNWDECWVAAELASPNSRTINFVHSILQSSGVYERVGTICNITNDAMSTTLKPNWISTQKPSAEEVIHTGAIVIETQRLIPLTASVGVAVVVGAGCKC